MLTNGRRLVASEMNFRDTRWGRSLQIKAATDLRNDVEAGEALLRRFELGVAQRREIDQKLRFMRAGLRAEEEAAYHIELFFGRSPNFMTIHDLRFEVGGYSAQIDHLVLNRLSEIWVCESKHFVEGATINEQGEWSRRYRREEHGMESPIAQNRRHILLLKRAFDDGLVVKPRRFGLAPMKPVFRSLVLISKDATIKRPRRRVPDLDQVIKVEEIDKHIRDAIDTAPTYQIFQFMRRPTVEKLGRGLAALHSPKPFDWLTRFGVASEPLQRRSRATEGDRESEPPANRPCESCGGLLTLPELRYTTIYQRARFGGRALCRSCQSGVGL